MTGLVRCWCCHDMQASLMTGRDTFRTGMQFEVVEDSAPWGLPLEEVTLAERFKVAGYSTHMVSHKATITVQPNVT